MKTEAQKILEELKNKYKVTDEMVAVEINKTASTIWRWRKGKNHSSLSELNVLKEILKEYQKKSNL